MHARIIRCAFALALGLALALPASAQVIKIATLAPDGSAWMRELRAAAAEVKAGTDGRVDVKFYPGGVMGNDAVVLRKMRLGQLQGGILTSSELSLVYPDAPIYSLPFLMSSWDDVDRVRAEVDPMLAKGFEAHGIRMLGVSGLGFAYLMGDKPLGSAADMAGRKLWVPQNDAVAARIFEMGGVSTIPLPIGDVFTSLQTGLVDTVVNTPSGAVVLQWHGKMKHMVDLPLTFVVGFLVVDDKAWKKLAPADQAVLAGAFAAAGKRMDANTRRDDAAALEAMKKQGLKVSPMDPAEARRWRELGTRLIAEMEAEGKISPDMLAAVRRALAKPTTP
ncbi:MAG TPA: TRAP transporter substrate-binding protein DctP [Arenimonas sp.]|uniref:TRAP transporter substrate-binding protein DctP n=1 Tax=Arenimonas sp. TaxID=1872635 RepID=UPI002D7F8AA6|nr:TRAP transporter substrate-binding protein DctP [Arenimonas sp.]HEU0153739.1 TRAP transporter substrate-binding protein DctP [Arenimonas sp.]